ncbi:hypothetical protein HPB47_023972, partial [Ixodes persulcatus]
MKFLLNLEWFQVGKREDVFAPETKANYYPYVRQQVHGLGFIRDHENVRVLCKNIVYLYVCLAYPNALSHRNAAVSEPIK